ncbi:MAG: sigma-70 family RNA polymerase sigma factor, partial [Salinibacterium sp.]
FAELWHRHYLAGMRIAHQFTSIDADDLVSEAYTRIFQRIRAGGGPTGAFRPYLYATIRNLASSWGAARRDIQVDDITVFEDPRTVDDATLAALDRSLTARAFRTLPERWQTVLWYTEVEGMDPHEVAPLLGLTANGVAALAYRAREGLRKAWLQAHLNDDVASPECRWTIAHLGDHARSGLGERDEARIRRHLSECTSCPIINDEVDDLGSRLAIIVLPLVLGGAVGGSLLGSLGSGTAAAAAVVPPLPAILGATGAGAGISVPALVGTIAVVAAISTGAAISSAPLVATTQNTDHQSLAPADGTVLGLGGTTVEPSVPGLDQLAGDASNSLPTPIPSITLPVPLPALTNLDVGVPKSP